jgi:arylsulfatase A-like enzyme
VRTPAVKPTGTSPTVVRAHWLIRVGWFRSRPQPETVLLFVSGVWTIIAKALVLHAHSGDSRIVLLAALSSADVVFFLSMAMLFSALHWMGLKEWAARMSVALAGIVLAWSVLNAAWLMSTSVQLQPGVLTVLLGDLPHFWPTVQAHLASKPLYACAILVTTGIGGSWFVYRLYKPVRNLPCRLGAARVSMCLSIAVIALYGLRTLELPTNGGRQLSNVMGFSSHWAAMTSVCGFSGIEGDVAAPQRLVARAGQRHVGLPAPDAEKPNVIVIFLESVSYRATSLGDHHKTNTPTLARLASEGVEFTRTYVPVAQTNKALFAALTGCVPDVTSGYTESVLVDQPYESLATLLKRRGYRSSFFQMADGYFGCEPGLLSNMGWDWAWFFENLQDESARLGYLSGDDFRMLGPMFDWVDEADSPFLLTMITTVSHDPFTVPKSFDEHPSEDRNGQYLRAVEYGDRFLAAVIERLEMRGMLENTVLCVLGDHGECFRADARGGRWVPYEEVVRIPWVIRWPHHVDAGSKIDSMSWQADVTPTILSLLGWDVSHAEFDGRDAMVAPDDSRKIYFNSWYKDSPVGYVQGDRKLVYWPYLDSLFEYDLSSDPEELAPVEVNGIGKSLEVREICKWRDQSRFMVEPQRFRERKLYGHWVTMSSGSSSWAFFVP